MCIPNSETKHVCQMLAIDVPVSIFQQNFDKILVLKLITFAYFTVLYMLICICFNLLAGGHILRSSGSHIICLFYFILPSLFMECSKFYYIVMILFIYSKIELSS